MSTGQGQGEPAEPGPRVFMSYRREDTEAYAGRLHENLVARFGADNVFMDIDSIEPGVDFTEVLEETLDECNTVLVMIGRSWTSVTDGEGRRRLDNPDDYVRREIERAFSRGTRRIIPVLVGGADVPAPDDLPESLAGLSMRQAYRLSNHNWSVEVRILSDKIEKAVLARRIEPEQNDAPRPSLDAQLSDPRRQFPAQHPPQLPPSNLRLPRTSFVGRETQLAQLKAVFEQNRLVTILGPGGVGKTRTAYRVAADLRESFNHGVWVVELAPIADSNLVADATASVLPLPELVASDSIEVVLTFLADKELLLILDNCEQVLAGVAELADRLMDDAPQVTVLATSRVPLDVIGEVRFLLEPLALPEPDAAIDELLSAEAIRLFVDRARAVKAGFVLNAENARAVTMICQRLDGLPLALELAGARVATMAPGDLLDRLDKCLTELRSDARGLPERHRTLQSTIAWSYGLLSEAEQALLARLAIFAGRFPRLWAEQVCAFPPLTVRQVSDGLDSATAKSLLVATEHLGRTEYQFLLTVHEYAASRLDERGETSVLELRRADFLARHLASPDPLFQFTADTRTHLAEVAAASDDLRASLVWSLEHDEAARACALVEVGCRLWNVTGRIEELYPFAMRAIALSSEPSFALLMTYYAALLGLDVKQSEASARTLARPTAVRATEELAEVAKDVRGRMVAVATELGDPEGVALALYCQADLPWSQGNFAEAARLYHEAADTAIRANSRSLAATIRRSEAEVVAEGDDSQLAASLDGVIDEFRAVDDPQGLAVTLAVLAGAELGSGAAGSAASHAAEGLDIARKHGYYEIRWRHLTLLASGRRDPR